MCVCCRSLRKWIKALANEKIWTFFSLRFRFVFATKSIFKRSTRCAEEWTRGWLADYETCTHSSCVRLAYLFAVRANIRASDVSNWFACSDHFIIQQTLKRKFPKQLSLAANSESFFANFAQSFSATEQVKLKCARNELHSGPQWNID